MKIRLYSFSLSMCALLLSQASAQTTYTWTGGADGDWENDANWLGSIRPIPNMSGALDTRDLIVITAGPGVNQPTTNLFELVNSGSGNTANPRFELQSGANLSLVGAAPAFSTNSLDRGGIAFTVADGATFNLGDSSTTGIILARPATNTANPPRFQTFDISGSIIFTNNGSAGIGLANQFNSFTAWELDGGSAIFNVGIFNGATNNAGDFTSTGSVINLANGSTFDIATSINNTNGGSGGTTFSVDFQDSASSFEFELGGDFVDLAAVQSTFGSLFTTSTPGLVLNANQVGSTITVSAAAIPEPTTSFLMISAGLLGLLVYRRRRA